MKKTISISQPVCLNRSAIKKGYLLRAICRFIEIFSTSQNRQYPLALNAVRRATDHSRL
ncbi:MAG: hypothetical protein AAF990_10975 [Bacteroidota bacterium]